jgi:UDPglucose--hexose-1-phosphate uridylyltransferase
LSELRYNVATREWVVIAPERGRRPNEFQQQGRPRTADRPAHRADCPFCPGGEQNTPGETLRYLDSEGNWLVRSFPNRYPALSCDSQPTPAGNDVFRRKLRGSGVHEVVAESPLHNQTLALQPLDQVLLVLKSWRERSRSLHAQHDLEHITIFKNHGLAAGTSLEHPHSQIIGLPVVPSGVRGRLDAAQHYYQTGLGCVFCGMLQSERQDGERVVVEGRLHTAFVPFAAYSPYSMWILPHRHGHCFGLCEDDELEDLAQVVRQALAKLYHGLGDPDYNLMVRSGNPPGPGVHYWHWYLAIVPRLSRLAGFELGTGMFICASLPEADAAYLRGVAGD